MKLFGIFTILFSIATLSYGILKYNCYSRNEKPCEILMTPEDDVFKKLFMPMLDALTQFAVQFGITGYENDPKKILGQVNEDLKEVNQTTIKQFVGKLGTEYKNPTYVELIADYDPFFLPDHVVSSSLRGLSRLGGMLSGFKFNGR